LRRGRQRGSSAGAGSLADDQLIAYLGRITPEQVQIGGSGAIEAEAGALVESARPIVLLEYPEDGALESALSNVVQCAREQRPADARPLRIGGDIQV
jgi:hypothetical protein